VSYLFNEDGMFDWSEATDDSLGEIISEMGEARWSQSMVGMSLLLPNSIRGGDLLFHPGRFVVSFVIAINRKNLSESSQFCDIGWYLERLVPVFEGEGLREIESRDSP
jgi:hypothetical protein